MKIVKRKKRIPMYTQGYNECTLYTMLNIIRTQWGIIIKPNLRMKFIAAAESSGIFSHKSGAIFRFIYNWFTGWFYKKYGVEISIKAENINSKSFEKGIAKGNTYGLGLMYASNWYKKARANKEITMLEVDSFRKENNKQYGHNHSYRYEYIIDTLRSIKGRKIIYFPLPVLREAVKKGIYWPTARTITMNDTKLDFYLRGLNSGEEYDLDKLKGKDLIACNKAIQLRDSYLFEK